MLPHLSASGFCPHILKESSLRANSDCVYFYELKIANNAFRLLSLQALRRFVTNLGKRKLLLFIVEKSYT
jgi:hypothetical protein